MRITTITATVSTADREGADTHGGVHLGICGREFTLESGVDDFARGMTRTFVLGAGSNALNPAGNDPRTPPLSTGDLAHFPVYVRFGPRDPRDTWCLENVTVAVNPGSGDLGYGNVPLLGGDKRLWLADDSGRTVYLKEQ
ncbi:hypothetical protein [Streptomyces sp. ODS28]|uniref:hypothetical protein n=1 Tax=Streptomyces sp. ODS28 TaxID=3136688 RepID=UPI0031E8E8ED